MLKTLKILLFVYSFGSEGCCISSKWLFISVSHGTALVAELKILTTFRSVEFIEWSAIFAIIKRVLSHKKEVEFLNDVLVRRGFIGMQDYSKLSLSLFETEEKFEERWKELISGGDKSIDEVSVGWCHLFLRLCLAFYKFLQCLWNSLSSNCKITMLFSSLSTSPLIFSPGPL